MTKRFSKISPSLWRSKRFMELRTDSERVLFLYFLTSGHQTSIGAYPIPEGYALDDLSWDAVTYRSARKALIEARLIVFDEGTHTVYVLGWFKHCPAMNASHAKACVRLIEELESDLIRQVVEAEFVATYTDESPPAAPDRSLPLRGSDKWPIQHGAAARAGRN